MPMMQETRNRIAADEEAVRAAQQAAIREFVPDVVERPVVVIEPPKLQPYSGPIASVGQSVLYHARPGDYRAGRLSFPALVLTSDPTTGQCNLVVFYDSDDWVGQQNVPARRGEERGWEFVGGSSQALADRVDRIAGHLERLGNMVIGDEVPYIEAQANGNTVLQILAGLGERLTALETKRGPGRPPKPQD